MPKFNPFTGQLDYVGVPVRTDSEIPSETGSDGDIQTQFVGTDGRLYFRVNGILYYVNGVQQVFAINIQAGQPIGLAGVTYGDGT